MVWKPTLYVIVSVCVQLKFFVFSYSYSKEYLKTFIWSVKYIFQKSLPSTQKSEICWF